MSLLSFLPRLVGAVLAAPPLVRRFFFFFFFFVFRSLPRLSAEDTSLAPSINDSTPPTPSTPGSPNPASPCRARSATVPARCRTYAHLLDNDYGDYDHDDDWPPPSPPRPHDPSWQCISCGAQLAPWAPQCEWCGAGAARLYSAFRESPSPPPPQPHGSMSPSASPPPVRTGRV